LEKAFIAMSNYLLSNFILAEIQKRDMSAREFARFIGASHSSVNRLLNYSQDEVHYPSVDFILRLAKATNKDVGEIMKLIDPDVPTDDPELDPQVKIIAERIQRLGERERRMVEKFVQSVSEDT
jgi:transcriptional regulator with XRE-family HTH domain